ncbi:hypothetical protein EMIT0373P_50102 [Pseudomonas chlororaphis]
MVAWHEPFAGKGGRYMSAISKPAQSLLAQEGAFAR